MLERHCGICHIPTEPTANAGALGVYDLSELEWSARMTDEQLVDAADRFAGEVNGFNGQTIAPDERAAVGDYVTRELKRRQRSRGLAPPD